MKFECMWCGQTIDSLGHAGWPYVHSIALLHFESCDARPPGITSEMIQDLAAQVADELEKKKGKS